MKAIKIQLILLWVLVSGLTAGMVWNYSKKADTPRLGYININEVFEGFNLKKDLQKEYLAVKNKRDKILDSLSTGLQQLSERLSVQKNPGQELIREFESRRMEFMRLKENYEEDNRKLSEKYDKEILFRLNQYVQEYGRENGYVCILGNDGNGSVMYAQESDDITKDVIEYLNSKYEGN